VAYDFNKLWDQQGQYDASRLTDHDIYLFKEGNHFRLYKYLGSHVMNVGV